jgi:hypothetical protein
MSPTDKKIKVIKREERLAREDAAERQSTEPPAPPPAPEEGEANEQRVVSTIKGWIEDLRQHKE